MPTAPPDPGTTRRRILLVDDEVQVLNCLARLLRRRGFDVRTTSSPRDALELLHAAPADVVIADFMMPEMTGTELLEEVRRIDPHARRVLLTGYADLESVGGHAAGVHLLAKPWDTDELMRRCRE